MMMVMRGQVHGGRTSGRKGRGLLVASRSVSNLIFWAGCCLPSLPSHHETPNVPEKNLVAAAVGHYQPLRGTIPSAQKMAGRTRQKAKPTSLNPQLDCYSYSVPCLTLL